MEHYQSNAPADPKGAAELEAARQRVADGKQLKPEHFAALTYPERVALFEANPERDAALRDGRDPDAAWTPTAAASGGQMTGANL
jgi:hypothetical protein